MPHSSQLYRDEWASQPRRPRGLDFNRTSHAGGVVVEAAPGIIAWRSNQSTLQRIAVDVADRLGAVMFAANAAVEIAGLPELFTMTSQFARSHLFQRLEELRQENRWRLVDEQVHMLGHQDARVDPCLMPLARPFKDRLHCLPDARCG